jgi:hypothetical protein
MGRASAHPSSIPSAAAGAGERAAYAAIAALGALLWWLSASHPALLPFWMPWNFSLPEYLATALALVWFFRGLALSPAVERPAVWRRIAFLLGVAVIYAVLQTRFEYWSQHMFFLHRIQHVVMHHLGPFLVALGAAGGTIRRGMPPWLWRIAESLPVAAATRVLQQPVLAAFLFVGLIYFWLIPPIHFRAMIDARLYAVMNWSMVLDGILFWWLVLDPRPSPPARVSYGVRPRRDRHLFTDRSLPVLRSVRPVVPVDQRAQRPAYRRHRHLDSTRDDERDRRARGHQRAQNARGSDDGGQR